MRTLWNRKAFRIDNFALFLALSMILIPIVHAAPSAADGLPSAEEVLNRYIEVTGGKDAYEKLNNTKSTGTFEMPAQGISMSITSYSARPNLMYASIESPQLGKIERGVSAGGVAWEKSMMTGASVKEGSEKEQMLIDATFNKLANWKKVYSKVENAGISDVDGRECYKIVFTTPGETTESSFFDKESGLLVKTERIIHSQMGDIPSSALIKDYRDVGGIKVAYVTEVDIMGQIRKITLDNVERNIELPEGIFDLPEEIAELVKKSAEGEKE